MTNACSPPPTFTSTLEYKISLRRVHSSGNNRTDSWSTVSNMDYRLISFVTLFAVFAASEAFQCYECEWREVVGIDTGDDDCLKVVSTTDISRQTNCKYCITKTIDKLGHNWIERSCSTANSCRDAEEEESWEDDLYTVQKKCCNSNKCNRQTFEPDKDAASSLKLTGGLLAAILVSLYVNFRL